MYINNFLFEIPLRHLSALAFICLITNLSAQQHWTTDPIEVTGTINANVGTENNRSLRFLTNDSLRMWVDSLGKVKINNLKGTGFRVVFADAEGNLYRGGGEEGVNEIGCEYCPPQDLMPQPSIPCIVNSTPWYEGGNTIGNNGNNTAGTCNNYDYILKANNTNRLWINRTNGNIGLGTATPGARLTVYEPTAVGTTQNNTQLLTRISGVAGTNVFSNNFWLRRKMNGTDWLTVGLHDGISIDFSFLTPGTDTKTWWERRPYDDVQLWGNGATTHMQLVQGNLYIGPEIPKSTGSHANARLSVDGKILAKEIWVNIHASNWADFVFNKNYKLKDLMEVDAFIEREKHLPDIPSAVDLAKEGLSLAEMQKLQMQKIEEIFLYLIEQQQELRKTKAELEKLKQELR
jgi:hypothetical protein